jgi:hypothetical protein
MADPIYLFTSQPGIRRDGTELDSSYFADGTWVRWQRGKPRKMGGYKAMTQQVNGPVRAVMLDSRGGVNSTHLFSQWGVQRVQFALDGTTGAIEDRTPAGFVADPLLNWSYAAMHSSTGGTFAAIIAASSPDTEDIANDDEGYVYAGDITSNAPLTKIADGTGDIRTSGGVCVLQPFLFVYGSNGLIRNSNANDYSTATGWTIGGANFASTNNIGAQKIVYGAPLRGGSQSPAGLFWGLDSLIRVSFVGGTGIWQYDTLACPSTVLAKNAIVEHDGKYFWPGTDRFMFYNGVVQELPNQMNSNYFFDNLNYAYQNKIFGVKVARWGEIWWFYPRGTDTECGNAIIFNYRESTWYDAIKERTAAAPAGVFKSPIMAGHEDSQDTIKLTTGLSLATSAQTLPASDMLHFTNTTGVVDGMVASGDGIVFGSLVASHTGIHVYLDTATTGVAAGTSISFTSMTTAFANNNPVTGSVSGATGTVVRVLNNSLNVNTVTGTFVATDVLTTPSTAATATVQSAPETQTLVTQYQHEYGWDKIVGQDAFPIESSFTSKNFGFAVGDPFEDSPKMLDQMTRILRLEPDMNQVGDMTVDVIGRSFAQDEDEVIDSYTLAPGASFQNMGEQARIMKLKFTTNEPGGFYELGQMHVSIEPGDERSTK